MKKTLLTAVLVLTVSFSFSYGAGMEEFLSMEQSFWQEGMSEFLMDTARHIKDVKVEPSVATKLEFLSKLSESYQIPAEELKKAYSTAVLNGAKEVIEELSREVLKRKKTGDGDVAFLMENLTGYVRFTYGSEIRKRAKEIAEKELREALKQCISLRISPMVEAFLKSKECRELLAQFPKDVEAVIYRELGKREKELFKNPRLTDEGTLRYILENLKKYKLAGG